MPWLALTECAAAVGRANPAVIGSSRADAGLDGEVTPSYPRGITAETDEINPEPLRLT
jgi:hypothetical protein